jgi:hypothetical protein
MSLIFKEKLNLEGKRRYERQKEINEAVVAQLQAQWDRLQALWEGLLGRAG